MTRITLWGWYQYKPDLFDDAPFPEQGNKQLFIDLLMERCGMLYTRHQQPDYLKQNITNWFTRKQDNFSRIFIALAEQYSPIENYDRYEDITETPDIQHTRTGGHTNSIEGQNNNTNTNSVSAFNSPTYQPSEQLETHNEGNSTETITYNSEQDRETGTRKHESHMHGNIGVTTNQQMIESELRLREYDAYEVMVKIFERDFLSQVYS